MKILLLVLFAAQIFAQDNAAGPEVPVTVIEPGIEHGVADADVAIFEVKDQGKKAGKVTTDSQGKFRFQLERFGEYFVTASKEGYGGDSRIYVTLSADHPNREIEFRLGRTGELTGRVVDEETGEPLVNFKIEVATFSYLNGRPQTGNPTLANTDDDGRFAVSDLNPGRYVVVARPRERVTQSSDTGPSTDYEVSYWPGGRRFDTVAPVTLISGGSTDVGVMKLRKMPLYAVRVAISETNCKVGESVRISTAIGSAEGSCGETSLLRNFQPGAYGLILTQGEIPGRSSASVRFEVIDKDVDLTASLARDVQIDSRLVAAEGAKIPFEKLGLFVSDVTGEQLEPPQWYQADSQGRVKLFSRAPFGKFSISLLIPSGPSFSSNRSYYIKEARFNGEVVADNLIALTGSLAPQSLEIVVDDKVGTITGAVNDGDHPASKPYVVLSKWPLPSESGVTTNKYGMQLPIGPQPEKVSGDDDGQFRFTGLAPDEYRVIAVSQTNREMLDEPGVLQRVLNGAETITLKRGSAQTVNLKLTDPSR
jgi:hypothetical protein